MQRGYLDDNRARICKAPQGVCVCVAQTHISDNHGQYVWPHTSWAPSKASCRKMSDHTHAEARAKMAFQVPKFSRHHSRLRFQSYRDAETQLSVGPQET